MHAALYAVIVGGICGLLGQSASAACQLSVPSTWRNELQSTMTLTTERDGHVTGTYQTAVGCGQGQPRPLAGFCNGHAFTFVVDFQDCASTTAWAGVIDTTGSAPTLKTLWHLVRAHPPAWNSVLAGAQTFTPAAR